jgi:TetR/AcrR family transcriptional repressor of nem operon
MQMNKTLSSRENLIAAARQLIIDRGFSAMSVSTVCAAANVTKGSFFHHFESKDELGEVVLEKFWTDVQENHQQAGYIHAPNPLSMLFGYIEHAIETYQNPEFGGCLLAIFTAELKDTNPLLYAKTVPYFSEWKAEVVALLNNAAHYCHLDRQFDSKGWADFYLSTVEGVLILAKAEEDLAIIGRVLTMYKQQLQSVLIPKN